MVLELLYNSIDNLINYVEEYVKSDESNNLDDFYKFLKNRKKPRSKHDEVYFCSTNVFGKDKDAFDNMTEREFNSPRSQNESKRVKRMNLPGLNQTDGDERITLPGITPNNTEEFKIVRKKKSVFKEHIISKIEDEEEMKYATPERLFLPEKCSHCGLRFELVNQKSMHESGHGRESSAAALDRIMRRGWFYTMRSKSDKSELKSLLEDNLKRVYAKFDKEKVFLSVTGSVERYYCAKCSKRIGIKYDNSHNKWYIEGVEVKKNLEYRHRGCV
ncbi:hypothetical protein ECANGB1_1870 [Enterospora canceri]|uniref:C2H2-type domain-containing protein n=1 Tax=Enterospora canceri TaxID=1081671 RepID=A0A1Y1S5C9_9MICR|nr:hypothetical protein ECANGB1_1870 [Enterospora canceri]